MSTSTLTNSDLVRRIREVRLERYGEHGGPLLAAAQGIPFRTWVNYEAGVRMPAAVLLRFLDATGTSSCGLLTGQGDRYARETPPPRGGSGSPAAAS
jgi:hypothetical protein